MDEIIIRLDKAISELIVAQQESRDRRGAFESALAQYLLLKSLPDGRRLSLLGLHSIIGTALDLAKENGEAIDVPLASQSSKCSFCGAEKQSASLASGVATGTTVFICDDCVNLLQQSFSSR